MSFRKFNTAESFALVRVLGFPLILLFIYLNERTLTAWFYILLFSTDFIDGFFAFFFGQESARRARLDTLGDVLLLLSGLVGFYFFEKEFFLRHSLALYLVLGLYLLQFIIALIKWKQPSSFHTYLAKLAAIAQVVFLCVALMFEASTGLFYFAILISIMDGIEDIALTLLLPKWQANIKGLLWFIMNRNASGSRSSK